MSRSTAAVAIVVLLLASAGAASADDAFDKREAQRHFADGLRAYDVAEFKHDQTMFDVAYQAFAQSYALNPTDKVLWNLALSEVNSGRYLKGLTHLRLYDEHQHVSAQPGHARLGLLRDYMARAVAGTAHLTIDAAAGTPITIDGVAVGVAPVLPQDMEPGTHVVEALGQRTEVKAAAGQVAVVTVVAPPALAAPPLAVVRAPLPPPNQVAQPTVAPDHSARDVVRWSTSGVAVAALGLGVGFLVDANGRAQENRELPFRSPGGLYGQASLGVPADAEPAERLLRCGDGLAGVVRRGRDQCGGRGRCLDTLAIRQRTPRPRGGRPARRPLAHGELLGSWGARDLRKTTPHGGSTNCLLARTAIASSVRWTSTSAARRRACRTR